MIQIPGSSLDSFYQIFEIVRSKVEKGVFTGPDIRRLSADTLNMESINEKETQAWESFKDVARKLLESTKLKTARCTTKTIFPKNLRAPQ